MKNVLFYFILSLSFLNLIRMGVYAVSCDAYSVRLAREKSKRKRKWHLPTVTVFIPAHNEETTIERCINSIYWNNYPAAKLKVVIANDGSTDNTKKVVRNFIKSHNDRCKLILVNRPNRGKASALNYAIKRYADSRLVMCLDSDSYLEGNAIRNAVQHFRNRNVVTLSSNINIVEDGSIMGVIQRIEYIVCINMKKAQSFLGVEYIIGGVGSMFRRRILERVEFYDSNTMTEDIDLTMKIITNKKKKEIISYAADSIVYTAPVITQTALRNQRFRWKYGRAQTFLKNHRLFFSTDKQHSKRITWFVLPFTILQDLIFFLQPLVLGYFAYISLLYGNTLIFVSGVMVLSLYLLFNLWASSHLSIKARLRLTYFVPPMYILMYVVEIAEYYALIKALFLVPKLKQSIGSGHTTWSSPERRTLTKPA